MGKGDKVMWVVRTLCAIAVVSLAVSGSLVVGNLASPANASGQSLAISFSGTLELVVKNYQNTTIEGPYQQMLVFDSALFQQIENGDLSNVKFSYPNGTVIPSWIESGASNLSVQTIYWLKLNGLAAASEQAISMYFAPKGTNFFNATGDVGEAPQLSRSYGEYDNGAQVFAWYENFAGTVFPSSMAYAYNDSYNASSYVGVDNGLWINTSGISTVGFGVHVNISFGAQTTTDIYGVPMYPNSYAYSAAFFGYDGGNGINNLTIGNPSGSDSVTFPYGHGNTSMPRQYGIWSVMRNGSQAWGMYNYTAGRACTGEPTGNYTLGDHGQGNAFTSFTQWWRVRVTPPSGVMPQVFIDLNNQSSPLPTIGNMNQGVGSQIGQSPGKSQLLHIGIQPFILGAEAGILVSAVIIAVAVVIERVHRKKL